MMRPRPVMPAALAPVALALLALMLLAGWWVWRHLATTAPLPPVAVAPTTPTPTATAASPPTPLRAPQGYRLAGVAVGEPDSFAVIEAPNGTNTLYRRDADIPGLGRLMRIEAERVVIQSEAGQFDLWLAAAPTSTPRRLRTAETATPTAPRPLRSPAGGTARGSSP